MVYNTSDPWAVGVDVSCDVSRDVYSPPLPRCLLSAAHQPDVIRREEEAVCFVFVCFFGGRKLFKEGGEEGIEKERVDGEVTEVVGEETQHRRYGVCARTCLAPIASLASFRCCLCLPLRDQRGRTLTGQFLSSSVVCRGGGWAKKTTTSCLPKKKKKKKKKKKHAYPRKGRCEAR